MTPCACGCGKPARMKRLGKTQTTPGLYASDNCAKKVWNRMHNRRDKLKRAAEAAFWREVKVWRQPRSERPTPAEVRARLLREHGPEALADEGGPC